MGSGIWDSIKNTVAGAAPLLGGALGGPAGAAAGKIVASALGTSEDPEAIQAALQDPEAAAKLRAAEQEHQRELRRMVLEAETNRLSQVNETYRKEIGSEDAFVRRARPMFLYVVAFSIAVEVLIAVYVIAVGASLADLATLYQALSIPQGIAATMCGVYLKKRSDDKAIAAGQQPQGLLSGLVKRMAGSGGG